MGFFSDIASEVRRGAYKQVSPPGPQIPASPPPAAPVAAPVAAAPEAAPAPESSAVPDSAPPKPETAAQPGECKPEATARTPEKAEQQPAPPAIDLTAEADAADEAQRRKEHEAAEARRRAEWDAKQAARKAAEQAELDRISAMSNEQAAEDAAKRVAADTERLTRRNMKEAVAEHIQAKCREDAAFARLVMHPAKSMVRCFQYINRKAREYAEQEMKDLGMERTGTYGCDVPDGLCYQWAEDYFNDPDAKEDHKDDEKFVEKPYVPAARKTPKAKTPKKSVESKKPAPRKAESSSAMEQISLI